MAISPAKTYQAASYIGLNPSKNFCEVPDMSTSRTAVAMIRGSSTVATTLVMIDKILTGLKNRILTGISSPCPFFS